MILARAETELSNVDGALIAYQAILDGSRDLEALTGTGQSLRWPDLLVLPAMTALGWPMDSEEVRALTARAEAFVPVEPPNLEGRLVLRALDWEGGRP
jgi:hypothetical protein